MVRRGTAVHSGSRRCRQIQACWKMALNKNKQGVGHQSSGWRRWCVWKPVGENCIIGASTIWAKGAANGSIVITASTCGADKLTKIQKGIKEYLWRYGTHGRFFHDKLFQLRMAISLLRTVLIDLIPLVAGISLSQVMTACYRSFTKCWHPTKSTQGRTFFDPEQIGMSLSNVQVKLVTNAEYSYHTSVTNLVIIADCIPS